MLTRSSPGDAAGPDKHTTHTRGACRPCAPTGVPCSGPRTPTPALTMPVACLAGDLSRGHSVPEGCVRRFLGISPTGEHQACSYFPCSPPSVK